MRNIKTLVVAAGAAVVLGGIGVGVAQAAGPGTAPAAPAVTSSTSSTQHSHESEARGRVAEGETHARHTGADDRRTQAGTDDRQGSRVAEPGDDHGSGGHGADD